MKVNLTHNPLAPSNSAIDFGLVARTRPAWISPQHAQDAPCVHAYRLAFELPEAATVRVHVSADERYLLYVDGCCLGRGPERGSDRMWFYETYDLAMTAGAHRLVAFVWQLGAIAPLAQVGLQGGFMLDAEGPHADLLSTRAAAWEAAHVGGLSFEMPARASHMAWFVEPTQITDGVAYPWGIETGDDVAHGPAWGPVNARREDIVFPFGIYPRHILHPAPLPAQLTQMAANGRVRHVAHAVWSDEQVVVVRPEEHQAVDAAIWQALLDGEVPLQIPPRSRRHVLIDLEQYVCAYPQLRVTGGMGSRIVIGWAEALHLDASGRRKTHRDEVAGHTFVALCRDVILPDGGARRKFEPLWWRSGRFVQLLVETGEQPLTVERFGVLETRYPLEMESRFASSDARLDSVIPLALRGLQMCAHETYMDCPYYEQLMYIGDSRLEALTTYVISPDDRLPRKSIALFNASRLPNGLVQARYPSRDVQVIPPFSLWWVGMVYDYALWRGDRAFVSGMLQGVRAVLDGFMTHVGADHLFRAPPGWNFGDWVPAWPLGVPPDAFHGHSGLLQWHLIYTLGLAAQLEDWAGEAAMARRWREWCDVLAAAANAAFWDEGRGLFADDPEHRHFSEHTQCLALLSGAASAAHVDRVAQTLTADPALTRTTIYFSHYLFETYRLLGKHEALFERLSLWVDLPKHGFKTTPEQPEPTRSDCHGWGAHPLFHFFATVLGIRPGGFGFDTVDIAPMPGALTHLAGEMIHPCGHIRVDLRFDAGVMTGQVILPDGLTGTLSFGGVVRDLSAGDNQVGT
jgi:hypothetical protein